MLRPILLLCGLISVLASPTRAQHNQAILQGTVTDTTGSPIPGATIHLQNTKLGTHSNTNGEYILKQIRPDIYTIIVSCVGYQSVSHHITLDKEQPVTLNVELKDDVLQSQEIVVEANSEAEEVRETGYTVSVIESAKQKNLTTDVNQVLKTTPGIHLRESGGLGSGFKLSLNGLSGNQIRYFIDGIPMENFGSALSLSNYPVNLIDRLEIYKGAVPISLGADALGGAINIITDFRQKSFIDAAFSTGSFGTRRGSINGQYANYKNGFFLKASSFINHSDNTYWMEDVPVHDLELGNLLGNIRTKRFHDTYTSKMFYAEAGLFNKKYADKISVSTTLASNRKNYQHPDNNRQRIFGHFHTTNNTFLVATTYRKTIGKLDTKGFVIVGRAQQSVVDTSTRKYNWAGDYIVRESDDPKGELFERRSHRKLSDRVIRSNVGADYRANDNHTLSVSATQSYIRRTGEDLVNVFNHAFESPNFIHKNLLGLSYAYQTTDNRFSATSFLKQYWYAGKIITQDYDDNDVISKPSLTNTGYGLAFSYNANADLQFKSSYEKAYRIPESFEILGDGIYINPNPTLQPERSHNVNLGTRLAHRAEPFALQTEGNLFYRYSQAFIRFNPLGPFGEYENLNNVQTVGIETSLNITYQQLLSLNINVTYQHLTDQTEFDEGLPNTNYKSRVPNVPYFFGNVRLGISPSPESTIHKFRVFWRMRYIHPFFLTWEDLGNRDDKNIIPRQITHDLQLEYALKEGTYNITLSVDNLTNALVYDNFNIPKPGRSLNTKFRFFLR